MERVQFGKTDLWVTRIGLGLAALGRPGYINLGHHDDLQGNYNVSALEAHAHKMLELAFQKGIRYFDVARSYGKAEQFLALWMADKRNLVIGSKWGYTYTAGWQVNAAQHEIKEHSITVLDRQWGESLETLGRQPNIYHIHSASLESGVLLNAQVIDRLWELKSRGVIIGLSLSGPGQAETLEQSMEIRSGELQLFQSVQVTWNLLETSATNTLLKARDAGYGIIVKETLANGRLTERNSSADFKEKLDFLKSMAAKHKTGVDAIAMAFVLQQPWASVILSGAASPVHLHANLKAMDVCLDVEDLQFLNQLSESPSDYWKTRADLPWN
jgi:aryl-alcohol dehydrogenase-like predicted oxidoreductase